MREKNAHSNNEPSEDLLIFLARTIELFNEEGWGQPGSILEVNATGDFKHRFNDDIVDPVDFIDSYKAAKDAIGLMLHWEYWPPAEIIENRPDAEIFRALLWSDKTGIMVAVIAGSDSDRLVLAQDQFRAELDHLSIGLASQTGSGVK